MKKEPKNHKALLSKFFLLIIFILLIANRTLAQCTHTASCACELATLNIDNTCATSCAGYQTHVTNLANPSYGLVNATSVSMSAIGFAGGVTVGVANIRLYDASGGGCVIVAGQPASGYTMEEFNLGGFNITFSTAGAVATVANTGTILLPVGYVVNFIVNVSSGGAIVTSRNYFFKITSTAYIVGDPHITTVDGAHYDFQAVGEFTVLREGTGAAFEIQIRHTAVATSGPITDSYSGLTTCVSLNTAVAARVGTRRISFQPNIDGKPDSSGMQLRIDGTLTKLDDKGIDLGGGGRIVKASTGAGIQIDFPDGASLVATSHWWSHYSVWYLNVNIYRTGATKGIMGVRPLLTQTPTVAVLNTSSKSWLPALPDGSSLGPRPQNLHDRFVQLYQTFADAWRVTDQSSLFDYAAGTSTATFTNKNWPTEGGQSCSIPGQTPLPTIALEVAQQLANGIVDPNLKANAIADVMVTGEPSFAKAYLVTEQINNATTATVVNVSKDTTNHGESVTFTAIVTRKFSAGTGPTGSVQFTADGTNLGQVNLDANGRAIFSTSSLKVGQHQIGATFIPGGGGTAFASSSPVVTHTVIGDGGQIWTQWWFWALLILILIILFFIFRKKKP